MFRQFYVSYFTPSIWSQSLGRSLHFDFLVEKWSKKLKRNFAVLGKSFGEIVKKFRRNICNNFKNLPPQDCGGVTIRFFVVPHFSGLHFDGSVTEVERHDFEHIYGKNRELKKNPANKPAPETNKKKKQNKYFKHNL